MAAVEANDSRFLINELKLLFLFVLSAVFLLSSVRIQLFCNPSSRLIVFHLGRSAISLPLTLSLITTLHLPLSAFWNAYLFILVISFWSDSIHSFFTSFSHTEQRLMALLPLVHPPQDTSQQLSGLSIEQGMLMDYFSYCQLILR